MKTPNMKNSTRIYLLCLVSCMLVGKATAANRYWISTGSSDWNNITNWSATSGGSGGASVPGSGDVAIYDGAGGSNGTCNLDIAPTIAGITLSGYSGTIDLNGNTLTISSTTNLTLASGTIANTGAAATVSLTTTGTTTFSGCHLTANVNCVSARVFLNGSTFDGTVYLEKNGASNDLGTGNNVFNAATTLVDSGSGFFASAYTSPDTFNADLTLTNTGSAWIALSDNSLGNTYNGNIVVNSTNGTASAGITFGNGPGTNISSTLASGKTITVGGTGFTAGRLLLRYFTQAGSTAQNLVFTGSGILYLGPFSTFNGNVDFRTPQIYLNDATYNGTAYLEKKGGASNFGNGGNIFNGTTTLVNSSNALFVTAASVADTFNTDVTLTNTGSSSLGLADIASNTRFNGNISVNITAGVGITIGFNSLATASLAEGKTITVGGTGFTGGTLEIRHFTQGTTPGGTTQTLTATAQEFSKSGLPAPSTAMSFSVLHRYT